MSSHSLPSYLPVFRLTQSGSTLERFTLLHPGLTNHPTIYLCRVPHARSCSTIEMYSSQEAAIAQRAREEGISVMELTEYFEKKVQEVEQLYVARSPNWRLGRAEYLVWTYFCESMSQNQMKHWLRPNMMTPSSW
jgi:hypothetical protein